MDEKKKPQNEDRHQRGNQTQSVLGKVASKVKDFFKLSRIFNIFQQTGSPRDEAEKPGCSTDSTHEAVLPTMTTVATSVFASIPSQNLSDTNQNGGGFTFSNPIEVLPANLTAMILQSASASIYDGNLDQASEAFVFTNPIHYIMPASNVAAEEHLFSPQSSHASGITAATREYEARWVKDSDKESRRLECEAVRPGRENTTGL